MRDLTDEQMDAARADIEELNQARRKGLVPSAACRRHWQPEQYREWSDCVEAHGYHRLAALFRRIADNWDLTPRRAS
jgi:hypothetical protein